MLQEGEEYERCGRHQARGRGKLYLCTHCVPGSPAPLEKTLMLGKIEGRRIRGGQRMGWLDGITESKDMNLSKLRSNATSYVKSN